MKILIIGGSRGIGKATALELVKDGHQVLITGRDAAVLEKTKESLPEGTLAFALDITKEEEVEKLYEFVKENFPVDGIVLNAAMFPDTATKKSVIKPEAEELRQMLEANVVAHYRIAQKFLPLLAKSVVAKIIVIGSTAGIRQDKGGIYGISKWALRSWAYALRDECRQYGIGVSLVNPGATFTETRKKNGPDDRGMLESKDLGILIATLFRLSPQAVVEQLDIRPLAGDTY